FQSGHFKQVSRDGLALASLFRLKTAEGSRGINETDDRASKFFRLLHETERFSVSVRGRHGKVPVQIFLSCFSFCLCNHSYRRSVKIRDSADNGMIILKTA